MSMPSLCLAAIELRVSDLGRSTGFYTRQLGFVATRETADRRELATTRGGPSLLTLIEDRSAKPAPRDAAGLFHAALRFTERASLGGWLAFAAAQRVEFDGFSDHGVSEAIYLSDPDGNGLECYADRPRAAWPFQNGELAMTTRPLDVDALIAASAAEQPNTDATAPLHGAHWGHLHLRVTDLARSEEFYRAALGVVLTQGSYPGARFLAADGYHHHLGLNTWGTPQRAQPVGALGLVRATFARANATAEREQRDPDGIALRVTPLVARAT